MHSGVSFKGVGKRAATLQKIKKIKIAYVKRTFMKSSAVKHNANYSNLYCYVLLLKKFVPAPLVELHQIFLLNQEVRLLMVKNRNNCAIIPPVYIVFTAIK